MKVSSRRCITSVGTRIEGSTSRTSNFPIRSKMRLIVPGLAARRSSRPAHSMKRGSPMRLGATLPATSPSPQWSTLCSILASRSSACHAHWWSSAQMARENVA